MEMGRPADIGRAALFLEKFFHAGDVFRHVHADGVVFDFGYANLPTVFEPAELLELLDAFELSLGQSGVFEEGVALEDVQAQMLEVPHLYFAAGIANPGDGRPRKINSIAIEIEDGLDDVGVHDVRGYFDQSGHRGDSRG